MYLPEKGYRRVIVLTFYVALGIAIAMIFFKYLFFGLLPFMLGWLFAHFLQPSVNFFNKKAHLPRKLTAIVLVVLAISVVGSIVYLIIARLYTETVGIAATLPTLLSHLPDISSSIVAYLEKIFENIPYIDITSVITKFFDNLDQTLISVAQNAYPSILNILKTTVTFVPFTIIYIIITIVSTCYLTIDYKKVNSFIAAQIPEKALNFLKEFKEQLFSTTFKYFRAYIVIILITFFESFVGFTIIQVKYSFIIALLVAIIDVLPVLGTGTVLIPWALIEFFMGDIKKGISLLVLYAVITIIRQIIEPKIVGSYIGLYPLVTLICMYVGVQLIGIAGLFAFPILAIILKNLNDKGVVHILKTPPKDENEEIKIKFKSFKKGK